MGEIIETFKGMPISNFESWFSIDGKYVEEFDTSDGRHWIAAAGPEAYPPGVMEEAIELGVVDRNGNVIPYEERKIIPFSKRPK